MDAGSLLSADLALFRAARTRGHGPSAERAVRAFSRTGEHAALWLAIGGLGIAVDRPRRDRWKRGVRAVAGAYVLNTAIKQVVRRRRPALDDLPPLMATPTQLSFPSAHASSSFAGARAYAPLLAGGHGGRVLYPLALAMAGSRVYLGVHYPSDILAGALLGTFVGDRAR
ncbi:MAG TPA: phosphatase PAP2 family protein [Baekduia sp.]|uniref:phosphatase PAP2 family protein n=1 Tax=Baekduia sp. TaxID=2600305 RepID=UPI002D77AC77|nr:phosphatase PAP2 family protein [Baekduia sp.]HET6508682.1 phosphatase PAP2 family protein [Baekduia sp.]